MINRDYHSQGRHFTVEFPDHEALAAAGEWVSEEEDEGVLRRLPQQPEQGTLFNPQSREARDAFSRGRAARQPFDEAIQRDDVWFHIGAAGRQWDPERVTHAGTLQAAMDAGGHLAKDPGTLRVFQADPVDEPLGRDEGDFDNESLATLARQTDGVVPYQNKAEDRGSISIVGRAKHMEQVAELPISEVHTVGVQPSMFLNEHWAGAPSNAPRATEAYSDAPAPSHLRYPRLRPRTDFSTPEKRHWDTKTGNRSALDPVDDFYDEGLQELQFRRIGGTDFPLTMTDREEISAKDAESAKETRGAWKGNVNKYFPSRGRW